MTRRVPLGLLQLSASLPPYRSDWKRVNLRVRFLTIRFLRRGVDFTIIYLFDYYKLINPKQIIGRDLCPTLQDIFNKEMEYVKILLETIGVRRLITYFVLRKSIL